MTPLHDKAALVTGSARGIGRAGFVSGQHLLISGGAPA